MVGQNNDDRTPRSPTRITWAEMMEMESSDDSYSSDDGAAPLVLSSTDSSGRSPIFSDIWAPTSRVSFQSFVAQSGGTFDCKVNILPLGVNEGGLNESVVVITTQNPQVRRTLERLPGSSWFQTISPSFFGGVFQGAEVEMRVVRLLETCGLFAVDESAQMHNLEEEPVELPRFSEQGCTEPTLSLFDLTTMRTDNSSVAGAGHFSGLSVEHHSYILPGSQVGHAMSDDFMTKAHHELPSHLLMGGATDEPITLLDGTIVNKSLVDVDDMDHGGLLMLSSGKFTPDFYGIDMHKGARSLEVKTSSIDSVLMSRYSDGRTIYEAPMKFAAGSTKGGFLCHAIAITPGNLACSFNLSQCNAEHLMVLRRVGVSVSGHEVALALQSHKTSEEGMDILKLMGETPLSSVAGRSSLPHHQALMIDREFMDKVDSAIEDGEATVMKVVLREVDRALRTNAAIPALSRERKAERENSPDLAALMASRRVTGLGSYDGFRRPSSRALISHLPLWSTRPILSHEGEEYLEGLRLDMLSTGREPATLTGKCVLEYIEAGKSALSAGRPETLDTLNSMGRLVAHDADGKQSVVFEDGKPQHADDFYRVVTDREIEDHGLWRSGLRAKSFLEGASPAIRKEGESRRVNQSLPLDPTVEYDGINHFISHAKSWFGPTVHDTPAASLLRASLTKQGMWGGQQIFAGNRRSVDLLNTDMFNSLELISSVMRELASNQNSLKIADGVVVRQILDSPVWLVCRGTSSRNEGIIFFSLAVDASRLLRRDEFDCFSDATVDGPLLVTKWSSIKSDRIAFFSSASSSLLSAYAGLEQAFGIDISPSGNPSEPGTSLCSHFGFILCLFLSDSQVASEIALLTRFLYMNTATTDYLRGSCQKILKKLPQFMRRPIDCWTLRAVLTAAIDHDRRSCDLIDAKLVRKNLGDRKRTDYCRGITSFVDGSEVSTAEQCVMIFYLGVHKNKDAVTNSAAEVNILIKSLKEERTIIGAAVLMYLAGDFEDILAMENDELGPHGFCPLTMIASSLLTKANFSERLGDWESRFDMEASRALASLRIGDVATLKASAKPHIEPAGVKMKDAYYDAYRSNMVGGRKALSESIELDSSGEPILIRMHGARKKCILATYEGVKNETLDYDFALGTIDKTVASVVAVNGVEANMFKKDQLGGVREITCLEFRPRLMLQSIERVSRAMCHHSDCEMLTKGTKKAVVAVGHRNIFEEKSIRPIINSNSKDKSTWCQLFIMKAFYCGLAPLWPKKYRNHLATVLNQMTLKKYELTPECLDILLGSKHDQTDVNLKQLVREIAYPTMSNRMFTSRDGEAKIYLSTGMGQGLLHYSSSLLHVNLVNMARMVRIRSMAVLSSMIFKDHYAISIRSNDLVSSDDALEALVAYISRTKATAKMRGDEESVARARIRVMLFALCEWGTWFPKRHCMMDSTEKSTPHSENVEEFNSDFVFSSMRVLAYVKYFFSAQTTQAANCLTTRIAGRHSSLAQIQENGGCQFALSIAQSALFLSTQRDRGFAVSRHYRNFMDIVSDIDCPGLGGYDFEFPGMIGLGSQEYASYRQCQRNRIRAAMEIYLRKPTNEIDGVQPSRKGISLGSMYRRKHMELLDAMDVGDTIHDELMSKPEVLLGVIETREDALLSLRAKALSPGVRDAFVRNASTFPARCSVYTLTSRCLFLSGDANTFMRDPTNLDRILLRPSEKRVVMTRSEKEAERLKMKEVAEYEAEGLRAALIGNAPGALELTEGLYERGEEVARSLMIGSVEAAFLDSSGLDLVDQIYDFAFRPSSVTQEAAKVSVCLLLSFALWSTSEDVSEISSLISVLLHENPASRGDLTSDAELLELARELLGALGPESELEVRELLLANLDMKAGVKVERRVFDISTTRTRNPLPPIVLEFSGRAIKMSLLEVASIAKTNAERLGHSALYEIYLSQLHNLFPAVETYESYDEVADSLLSCTLMRSGQTRVIRHSIMEASSKQDTMISSLETVKRFWLPKMAAGVDRTTERKFVALQEVVPFLRKTLDETLKESKMDNVLELIDFFQRLSKVPRRVRIVGQFYIQSSDEKTIRNYARNCFLQGYRLVDTTESEFVRRGLAPSECEIDPSSWISQSVHKSSVGAGVSGELALKSRANSALMTIAEEVARWPVSDEAKEAVMIKALSNCGPLTMSQILDDQSVGSNKALVCCALLSKGSLTEEELRHYIIRLGAMLGAHGSEQSYCEETESYYGDGTYLVTGPDYSCEVFYCSERGDPDVVTINHITVSGSGGYDSVCKRINSSLLPFLKSRLGASVVQFSNERVEAADLISGNAYGLTARGVVISMVQGGVYEMHCPLREGRTSWSMLASCDTDVAVRFKLQTTFPPNRRPKLNLVLCLSTQDLRSGSVRRRRTRAGVPEPMKDRIERFHLLTLNHRREKPTQLSSLAKGAIGSITGAEILEACLGRGSSKADGRQTALLLPGCSASEESRMKIIDSSLAFMGRALKLRKELVRFEDLGYDGEGAARSEIRAFLSLKRNREHMTEAVVSHRDFVSSLEKKIRSVLACLVTTVGEDQMVDHHIRRDHQDMRLRIQKEDGEMFQTSAVVMADVLAEVQKSGFCFEAMMGLISQSDLKEVMELENMDEKDGELEHAKEMEKYIELEGELDAGHDLAGLREALANSTLLRELAMGVRDVEKELRSIDNTKMQLGAEKWEIGVVPLTEMMTGMFRLVLGSAFETAVSIGLRLGALEALSVQLPGLSVLSATRFVVSEKTARASLEEVPDGCPDESDYEED